MSDNLSCPICLEHYDEDKRVPRLLPKCFHTFCQFCLKDLYNNQNQVTCSICRTINNVPFNEVPKNRDILQFVEFLKNNAAPRTSNAAYNNFATPSAPSGPSVPAPTPPAYSETHHHQHEQWDQKKYFRTLFNDIDHNSDGRINFNELHEALRRGQPSSEFDPITVGFLLSKFDTDHDNEINFDEFYHLFIGVTEQFNEFLDIDNDSSGAIDSSELSRALQAKGYTFTREFYTYLCQKIGQMYNKPNGISFDLYVRIIARFDYLKERFAVMDLATRTGQFDNSFEKFVYRNFFNQ